MKRKRRWRIGDKFLFTNRGSVWRITVIGTRSFGAVRLRDQTVEFFPVQFLGQPLMVSPPRAEGRTRSLEVRTWVEADGTLFYHGQNEEIAEVLEQALA